MSIASRRRALMIAGGEELPVLNPSVDITEGYYLYSGVAGYAVPCEYAGYTDFRAGANGDTIRYLNPDSSLKSASGHLGKILRFKTADHTNLQGNTNCRVDGSEGSFQTTTNQKWFQINVDVRNLAGSYCYNVTTGQIYWAGKDTPYYGKTNIND